MEENYRNAERMPQQSTPGFGVPHNAATNFNFNHPRMQAPPQFPVPSMPFQEPLSQPFHQQSNEPSRFIPPPSQPPPNMVAQQFPPPPYIPMCPPPLPHMPPVSSYPQPHGFYQHTCPPNTQQPGTVDYVHNSMLQQYGQPQMHENVVQPPQEVRKNRSEDENSDRLWINTWLKSVEKDKREEKSIQPSHNLKIFEVKEMMVKVTSLLTELESMSKSLSVIHKSLDDDQWKSRCEEIDVKKRELSSILSRLSNDKQLLADMNQKLNRRRKKRERERKLRLKRKDENNETRARRQQLHLKIDSWLEDMQDTVERGRREEEMKREADAILADVTWKKNDAKRQLNLLSALSRLRQARVVSRFAMGQPTSLQQNDAFNNVIDHLKKLWQKQLDDYLMEEHGLKVMLNEAAAEEKSTQALKMKMAVKQWEAALFGGQKSSCEHQPRKFDALVSVRKEWDRFVACEGSVMSSSIPTGWVVPVKPSSEEWKKLCMEK